MPKLIRTGLITLFITIFLVVICYFYVDKPVAFLMHHPHHKAGFSLLIYFTYLSKTIYILALPIYIIFLVRFSYHKLRPLDYHLLVATNSVVITTYVKDQIKFIFGRTWPETWVYNNPSLLKDNVFGFNFFHGGDDYASFPSGHTAVIVAAMTVLWHFYPRWRVLYVLAVALVVTGLVGMNYHFLSDVIAGGSLGWYVAYCVIELSAKPSYATQKMAKNKSRRKYASGFN